MSKLKDVVNECLDKLNDSKVNKEAQNFFYTAKKLNLKINEEVKNGLYKENPLNDYADRITIQSFPDLNFEISSFLFKTKYSDGLSLKIWFSERGIVRVTFVMRDTNYSDGFLMDNYSLEYSPEGTDIGFLDLKNIFDNLDMSVMESSLNKLFDNYYGEAIKSLNL